MPYVLLIILSVPVVSLLDGQVHPASERVTTCTLLKQSRLTLQDLQSLFEAGDLGLVASLAISIRLGLLGALRFNPRQVLQNCIQLRLHTGTVRGQLTRCLVQ